ncbi:MAG: hypothetical protein WBV28_04595 [Terracidiphilus sp.]
MTLRSELGGTEPENLGDTSAGRGGAFTPVSKGAGRADAVEAGGPDAAPGLGLKKLVNVESPEAASETPGEENPLARLEPSLFLGGRISFARLGGTPVSLRKIRVNSPGGSSEGAPVPAGCGETGVAGLGHRFGFPKICENSPDTFAVDEYAAALDPGGV